MDEAPLVSVLMSAYNHEKFVRQAIESIINQTYKNIELIVIDDGSKDNTPFIIEELRLKQGFYFERQINQGTCYTLNKLIAIANGKYLMLTASDDYYARDKIEKQVAFMENNTEYGICFGNATIVDEENNVISQKINYKNYLTEYYFEDIFLIKFTIIAATGMFRKEIFDRIGCYDEKYKIEDFYYLLKAAYNGIKIVIANDNLSFYRIHSNNMTKNYLFMFKETMKILEIYRSHLLYPKAKRNLLLSFFPYLSLKEKKFAFRILTKVSIFHLRFYKGIICLLLPYKVVRVFNKKI